MSSRIGYVEFRSIEHVEKAIGLTGTVVMGLPIMVQLTEAERNKTHAGDGYAPTFFVHNKSPWLTSHFRSINLPPGVSGAHGAM